MLTDGFFSVRFSSNVTKRVHNRFLASKDYSCLSQYKLQLFSCDYFLHKRERVCDYTNDQNLMLPTLWNWFFFVSQYRSYWKLILTQKHSWDPPSQYLQDHLPGFHTFCLDKDNLSCSSLRVKKNKTILKLRAAIIGPKRKSATATMWYNHPSASGTVNGEQKAYMELHYRFYHAVFPIASWWRYD